jgi:hypothetical protein
MVHLGDAAYEVIGPDAPPTFLGIPFKTLP